MEHFVVTISFVKIIFWHECFDLTCSNIYKKSSTY